MPHVYAGSSGAIAGEPAGPDSTLLRTATAGFMVVSWVSIGAGLTGAFPHNKGVIFDDVAAEHVSKLQPADWFWAAMGPMHLLSLLLVIWMARQKVSSNVITSVNRLGWAPAVSSFLLAVQMPAFIAGTVDSLRLANALIALRLVVTIVAYHSVACWREPRKSLLEFLALDVNFALSAGWTTVELVVQTYVSLASFGLPCAEDPFWTDTGMALALCVAVAATAMIIRFVHADPVWPATAAFALAAVALGNQATTRLSQPVAVLVIVLAIAALQTVTDRVAMALLARGK